MDQEVLDLGVVEQQQLREQSLRTAEAKADAFCEYLASARIQTRSSRFYDGPSRSLYLFITLAISDVMNGSDSFPRSSRASSYGRAAGRGHTYAACDMNWYIVLCQI